LLHPHSRSPPAGSVWAGTQTVVGTETAAPMSASKSPPGTQGISQAGFQTPQLLSRPSRPVRTGHSSVPPVPAPYDGSSTDSVPGSPIKREPGPARPHAADTRAGDPAPTKPGRTGPAHAFLRSENIPGPKRESHRNFPGRCGRAGKCCPHHKVTGKKFSGPGINRAVIFSGRNRHEPKKIWKGQGRRKNIFAELSFVPHHIRVPGLVQFFRYDNNQHRNVYLSNEKTRLPDVNHDPENRGFFRFLHVSSGFGTICQQNHNTARHFPGHIYANSCQTERRITLF
jgi:hypothetical protein